MKILVSVPNTGWIHKGVAFATDMLLRDRRVTLIRPTEIPYENNLAHIRNQALEDGFDWWLNIDSDNPPIRDPLELIELDLPLIGLPTPVWHTNDRGERPIYWNAYKRTVDGYTEWPEHKGLQRVDAIGTGCFLCRRDVLEKVSDVPFVRTYNADGTVARGNDMSWSERVDAAGFMIHAHFDYPCRHFKELELTEVILAFQSIKS